MPPTPIITLLPSYAWPVHHHSYPKEREVNREALVHVAPDREELLLSGRSVEELRQMLKIHVKPGGTHWLYRNRIRGSMNPASGGNTRISTLIRGTSNDTQVGDEENEIHVLRRVLSTSALSPFSRHRPHDRQDQDQDIDVWGTVVLSSLDQLVSPRPLGPTHILVVHSTTSPRRRKLSSSHSHSSSHRLATKPNFVELPINDLLFVLTVPNLPSAPPNLIHASERGRVGPLPPRQHKELPRVLLYVPHLQTFPELVVYLHTMNQAELFRRLVPEWIRDLMHPLPVRGRTLHSNDALLSFGSGLRTASSKGPGIVMPRMAPLSLLGLFLPGSAGSVSSNSSEECLLLQKHDVHPLRSYPDLEHRRTVAHIVDEIASHGDDQQLIHTVARLNALRDNLEYIGYFDHILWYELDMYRDILVRAVSAQASVTSTGTVGMSSEY